MVASSQPSHTPPGFPIAIPGRGALTSSVPTTDVAGASAPHGAEAGPKGPTLWAVSDLHAAVKANGRMLDTIQPQHPGDWLIVAGDVAERTDVILQVMAQLRKRFAKVIWTPGNHELFARSTDRYQGKGKYEELVRGMRAIDVLTPEDPFPVFQGVTICPLFTFYDYSFRPAGMTEAQAIARAESIGAVLTDHYAIAPFVDTKAWCWDRLAYSIKRLSKVHGPTVLVNHWPLAVEPVNKMALKEIAIWCGSRHTRNWPERYNAQAVIYGHLHMPSIQTIGGVPHIEVSLGYPREWERYGAAWTWPYPVIRGEGE